LFLLCLSHFDIFAGDTAPYRIEFVGSKLIVISNTSSARYVFDNYQTFQNFILHFPLDKQEEKEVGNINEFIRKAKEFYAGGHFKKAWNLLKKAEEMDPKNPIIKTMSGSIQLHLGNIQEAIYYYKESLDIDPNQPDVKKQLKELEGKHP